MTDLRPTAVAAVRARIARAILAVPADLPDAALGSVTLHAHQRVAVARLAHALRTHGGALLAVDVGLGKTYVALAIARHAAPMVGRESDSTPTKRQATPAAAQARVQVSRSAAGATTTAGIASRAMARAT